MFYRNYSSQKKGVPIFKAFRKGPLIRHTSQGGIAHRAESPDCQPCWFRPWRHEVARSGGQVPQGEGTKAGGPSQEPRAMALGPGFPKWWGGVEFWNQYPIFEHTNQPCPLETISALLSQASKMVLYIVIPYSILLHFRSLGHRIIFYLNRPWKVWSLMVKVFIPWVTSFQVLTPGDLLLCRQGKDRFPGECHKGKRCFERSHQPGSSHPGRLDWWGRSFSCWGLAPFGSWPSRRRQEHLGSCHKLCAGQAKGYQAQHRTSSASCSQNVGRELILVCWMDIMDHNLNSKVFQLLIKPWLQKQSLHFQRCPWFTNKSSVKNCIEFRHSNESLYPPLSNSLHTKFPSWFQCKHGLFRVQFS